MLNIPFTGFLAGSRHWRLRTHIKNLFRSVVWGAEWRTFSGRTTRTDRTLLLPTQRKSCNQAVEANLSGEVLGLLAFESDGRGGNCLSVSTSRHPATAGPGPGRPPRVVPG